MVSYHAIGASLRQDQEHRFVALNRYATGMKNPTSGNLTVMFNGIYATQNKQILSTEMRKLILTAIHLPTLFFAVPMLKRWL